MVVAVLPAVGCGTSKEYIRADDLTFKAIAPEYIDLVNEAKNADGTPKYTQEERERRARTVETWRLRIDKGEPDVR
jgi:hypothetical protein